MYDLSLNSVPGLSFTMNLNSPKIFLMAIFSAFEIKKIELVFRITFLTRHF